MIHLISANKSMGSFYEDSDTTDTNEIYHSESEDPISNKKKFFIVPLFDNRSLSNIIAELSEVNF